MKRHFLVLAAVVLVVAVGSPADAQQRGRGGFGGGFGGFSRGGALLGLVSVDKVQQEIEALDEQVADIGKLREELRGQARGGERGRTRRPGAEGGNRPRGERGAQGERRQRERGADGERRRRSFEDLTDEQRAEFRKRAEEAAKRAAERAKMVEAKLAEILLPHQMDRLKEIQLQVQGAGALRNKELAAKLKLTPEQIAKMEKVTADRTSAMREEMTALFRGGNRDGIREKLTQFRKDTESQLLAVLTGEQKTQFTALKGDPFEMPENAFRFGGGRGRGEGGGRTGRPERPRRPGSGN